MEEVEGGAGVSKRDTGSVEAGRGRSIGRRQGNYGFDAPYAPIGLATGAVICLGIAALSFKIPPDRPLLLNLVAGVALALSALSYVWTTRRGKFTVWAELLDSLALKGDERLLDVGCGRGAVLMLAAERLPRGRAVGVDLWSKTDQSGNSERATLRNAELEGVRDRVELHTGDMRRLPFPDESFDVVTSSLAIHNIGRAQGRRQALSEMLRVLKKGGTLMIADIRHAAAYQRYISAQLGAKVDRRRLGWRFWYGGPHAATSLVRAKRPRT